ncbi:hypothetical protein NDU88_002257 [Pleurodeles waltl]|uniref:Uncharacterized protein n=1 Tax=Pleurodeles waltl TaxID=8319 RepID=A0AAV7WKQ8_PLEWA|nr:hypothetical protein NDU88_002257 [Pleurodeles waltl]
MTPDFRIPGEEKSDYGLHRGSKAEDAEDPEETAGGESEQDERRFGNPDVPREAADPVEKGRSEETRRNRHVPGGVWLTKVRSFFKGQLTEKQKNWDRREEGRDSAEGAERGAAGRGQGSDGRNREKDIRGNFSIGSSSNLLSP